AGALAVQEGLQLDTMRGQPATNADGANPRAPVPGTTKFIQVEYEVSKDVPETVEDKETGETKVVTRKVTERCLKNVPGEVIPAPAPDPDEETVAPEIKIPGFFLINAYNPSPTTTVEQIIFEAPDPQPPSESTKWEWIPSPNAKWEKIPGPSVKLAQ